MPKYNFPGAKEAPKVLGGIKIGLRKVRRNVSLPAPPTPLPRPPTHLYSPHPKLTPN